MSRARVLVLTAVLLAIGALADVATGTSGFPGQSALIGVVGCALIVLVSNQLGRFLSRPEDVYPDEVPADRQEDLRG